MPSFLRSAAAAAAVATVVLTVAVTSTVVAAPAQAQPNQPLSFGDCPADVATPSAVCATMAVPLDYADPAGPTIDVMVLKQPATGTSHGVIFGNPGGPGGDALTFFDDSPLFTWPAELRRDYDLIAVQPRGLEHSTPVRCDPPSLHPFIQATDSGGSFRAGCEANTPGYTAHITTENTARDWEQARQRLGVDRIDIYGLSYGTILGSVYATLFPEHTDKVVLDSGVDPSRQWAGVLLDQNAAYKQRMDDMFAWIAEHDSEYHLGTTALQVYQRWSDRVLAESGVLPTVAPPPAQVGDVPPALQQYSQLLIDGFSLASPAFTQFRGLLSQMVAPGAMQLNSPTLSAIRNAVPQSATWPSVARALRDGIPTVPVDDSGQPIAPVDMDDDEIVELVQSMVTSQAMEAVMVCNENEVPPNYLDYPAFLWTSIVTGDIFDLIGLSFSSGAACAGAPPVTRVPELSGAGLATAPLQLQAVRDPQTPYERSFAMAERMGSHVITVEGGDHGNFAKGNPTVDAAVLEYLRTGHTDVTHAPATPVIDAFGP